MAFKPIVLLPGKVTCCSSSVTIRNRPCFPLVYTCHGTNVAASFSGFCKSCKNTYYHSYFEREASDSNGTEGREKQQRTYYEFAPDLQYFQVSNQTFFESHLVKDIVYNVEVVPVHSSRAGTCITVYTRKETGNF